MAGEKWAKTADALIAFVKATTQQDRVWITFFESAYRDFAEKPLGRDALLRDPNFQSIAELGTGGGTELLPALRHVLGIHQRFSARRRSHIILITDGQIANEEAVLNEISGKALPVHCFGIDHAVNEAFLRQLSGQQRGTSVFLTPNDDLVRPVAILGSRLRGHRLRKMYRPSRLWRREGAVREEELRHGKARSAMSFPVRATPHDFQVGETVACQSHQKANFGLLRRLSRTFS